jgi:hypothetical protein
MLENSVSVVFFGFQVDFAEIDFEAVKSCAVLGFSMGGDSEGDKAK